MPITIQRSGGEAIIDFDGTQVKLDGADFEGQAAELRRHGCSDDAISRALAQLETQKIVELDC